ncbi:hypothetical protein TUM20985_48510 [Mycobacterium antarcticum]|nr:hypothetical protein TUM20985_48510 [Mycolicibacterium sp. TUM20985]
MTDSIAGVDAGTVGVCASARSRGAASTWHPCTQRSEPLTTTPPSTANTAKVAAIPAPRARRLDVNKTPLIFGTDDYDAVPW